MTTARTILLSLAIATMGVSQSAVAASPKKVTVDQERLALLPLADQQRVLCIADRLEAITNTDRTDLTRQERKALRSELNGLKTEVSSYNEAAGGAVVYISGLSIILIIILLIILI